MRDTERDALMRVRAQAKLVSRLNERIREEAPGGLRAIRMDRIPRGSGTCSGLDAGMIKREEMARIAKREAAILKRMEKKARQVMEGMKPEMYAFCALYYLSGMGISDVAEAIDRSERQCMRYKREIEGAAGE